jgi:hypothetical protein
MLWEVVSLYTSYLSRVSSTVQYSRDHTGYSTTTDPFHRTYSHFHTGNGTSNNTGGSAQHATQVWRWHLTFGVTGTDHQS